MPRYHIVIVDGEQEDVKGLGECREQVAHYLFFLHSCRPLLSLSLFKRDGSTTTRIQHIGVNAKRSGQHAAKGLNRYYAGARPAP